MCKNCWQAFKQNTAGAKMRTRSHRSEPVPSPLVTKRYTDPPNIAPCIAVELLGDVDPKNEFPIHPPKSQAIFDLHNVHMYRS
jgi:hypothetical protein